MTKWRYSIPTSLLSKTTNLALTTLLRDEEGITGDFYRGDYYRGKKTTNFTQFSKDYARNLQLRFNGFSAAEQADFLPESITSFNKHQVDFNRFLKKGGYSQILYQAWSQDLGHNVGKLLTSSAGKDGLQTPEGYGPIYAVSDNTEWQPTAERPKKLINLEYNFTTDDRLIATQQFTHAQYRYRLKNNAWRYKKTSPIGIEYKGSYNNENIPHYKPTHIHVSNREQLGATLGETYRPQFFCLPDVIRHLPESQYTITQLFVGNDGSDPLEKGIHFALKNNNKAIYATIKHNLGKAQTVHITKARVNKTIDTLINEGQNSKISLNTLQSLAGRRKDDSYFQTLIKEWPKESKEESFIGPFEKAEHAKLKHLVVNFKGNVVLRRLAQEIENNFKYSAPDSPSLPSSFFVKNNFRYVFKEEDETYNWNPINVLMFVPKFLAEYIPLVIADLSLLAIDNYRKQSWRHTLPILPRIIIDIIPLILLSAIHYTAKLVYWFGRTLTSPVESYEANRAIHPKLGILMAGLSVLSTIGLSALLGLFVAPLISPHCVVHLASSNILMKLGSFLSVAAQSIGCASQCALTAISTLSSFLLFFLINPAYKLLKNHSQQEAKANEKENMNRLFRTEILKPVREAQIAENERIMAPPAIAR